MSNLILSSPLVLHKMTLFVDCTVTGAKTAKGHCTVTFLSIIGLVTKCYCTCNGSQTKHFVLNWRSLFFVWLTVLTVLYYYARHLVVFCCWRYCWRNSFNNGTFWYGSRNLSLQNLRAGFSLNIETRSLVLTFSQFISRMQISEFITLVRFWSSK